VKKFLVTVSQIVEVDVYVEADNEEEAAKKACSGDGEDNPVPNSEEIDCEPENCRVREITQTPKWVIAP
jgi:hypothetical protein